jgi:hypothetical protein
MRQMLFRAGVAGAVVMACAIAALPARAGSTSWNFQTGNGGWIATGTWFPFGPDPDYQWKWVTSSTVSGGTSPHWAVRAQGVSPSLPSASFLTSPTFSTLVSSTAGLVPAQNVRISLAHDFFLLAGTTNGIPTTLGQLQLRLNPTNGNGNGSWLSLPLSAFTNGGSVLINDSLFGPSPFKSGSNTVQLVDQSAFVAPNYVTPTGAGALPYVSPGMAAFTGSSPGWPTAYVPSQAFLTGSSLVPPGGISSMQLRLTNLNLAANCAPTDGWNVRFVQVDYLDEEPIPPVPEPGTLALGATGLAAALAAGVLRRRRHQRPSRPSDSP